MNGNSFWNTLKCKAGKVYVSVFPDFSEFRKHTANIAWETEYNDFKVNRPLVNEILKFGINMDFIYAAV